MKSLLIMFLMICATLVVRAEMSGVRVFDLKNAKFDPVHGSSIQQGTITVDYTAKSVKLEAIRSASPCPTGMFCALALPAPLVVELPLTSISDDACGIHQITAQRDERPADGALEEIKLEDVTEMTCQTFAVVVPHAIYRTLVYDRLMGKEVEAVSTMDLSFKMDSPSPAESGELPLVKAQLYGGFSALDEAKEGSLEINKDSVSLKVAIDVKCPASGPCPRVMSKLISETLPIVKRSKMTCGVRISARLSSKEQRTWMEIYDFRESACKRPAGPSVKVSYQKVIKTPEARTNQRGNFSFGLK